MELEASVCFCICDDSSAICRMFVVIASTVHAGTDVCLD
jgi:hypothetical protein